MDQQRSNRSRLPRPLKLDIAFRPNQLTRLGHRPFLCNATIVATLLVTQSAWLNSAIADESLIHRFRMISREVQSQASSWDGHTDRGDIDAKISLTCDAAIDLEDYDTYFSMIPYVRDREFRYRLIEHHSRWLMKQKDLSGLKALASGPLEPGERSIVLMYFLQAIAAASPKVDVESIFQGVGGTDSRIQAALRAIPVARRHGHKVIAERCLAFAEIEYHRTYESKKETDEATVGPSPTVIELFVIEYLASGQIPLALSHMAATEDISLPFVAENAIEQVAIERGLEAADKLFEVLKLRGISSDIDYEGIACKAMIESERFSDARTVSQRSGREDLIAETAVALAGKSTEDAVGLLKSSSQGELIAKAFGEIAIIELNRGNKAAAMQLSEESIRLASLPTNAITERISTNNDTYSQIKACRAIVLHACGERYASFAELMETVRKCAATKENYHPNGFFQGMQVDACIHIALLAECLGYREAAIIALNEAWDHASHTPHLLTQVASATSVSHSAVWANVLAEEYTAHKSLFCQLVHVIAFENELLNHQPGSDTKSSWHPSPLCDPLAVELAVIRARHKGERSMLRTQTRLMPDSSWKIVSEWIKQNSNG